MTPDRRRCDRRDTVLVVCTGNTCRSPVAQRVLAGRFSGEDIRVRSAGVSAASGAAATDEAVEAARRAGYELDEHRSRPLQEVSWNRVFLVVTMTHRQAVSVKRHLRRQPGCPPPVVLLGQLAGWDNEEAEVTDPFGGPLAVYEGMVSQLERMADRAAEEIMLVYKKMGREGDEVMAADCSSVSVFDNVALGCDHAGYSLKEEVCGVLDDLGVKWEDFGTDSTDSVDYPEFAGKVARAVAEGHYDAGILLCGTGIGMSIAANKVRGVRAAVCGDEFSARAARQHNNANVLALGSRTTGPGLAADMVRIFCQTPFEGGRHARRLKKITDMEDQF